MTPSPVTPILTRLGSVIEELGPDVRGEERDGAIAFSRGRLFALLEPAAETRLDVGLVLPGVDETERLRRADGEVTHRVSLGHEDEIDGELTAWLRAAYSGAAT